ncbi:MAG: hypothetical protein V4516_16305 [Pseudomonadota bacterium]
MSDPKGKPVFPTLRKADETRRVAARQSAGAMMGRFVVLLQNGKSTIPFVELAILFGFLALVFA